MHAALFWANVVAYVAGWTAIPVFDQLALAASVDRYALTAVVLSGAALIMLTYVLIFRDEPGPLLSTAAHSPWALSSAAASAIAFLTYFAVLEQRGMVFIVILQPVLIVSQMMAAWLVLREPIDALGWSGMALCVVGVCVISVGQARAANAM